MTLDASMSAVLEFRGGRIALVRYFLHRAEALEAARAGD